ncbi:DUF2878 domain-containing protein [Thiohalorhabdus sp.]|uniref:DUF2878 domain-containing protein n=1 Tax=Thiohalorhabdus sp. TaxID=3094134 RepID=UPI002FC31B07
MNAPTTPWLLFNLGVLNAGWFACVLGNAYGVPLVGPAVVAVLLAAHLGLMAPELRWREVAILLLAGAVGYAGDSALVMADAIGFDPGSGPGAPTKLWMVAMWLNFATALNSALYWLAGRPILASLLGAVGGPLAYLGGARLGALVFPAGDGWALVLIALEWALAMPLLLALNRWLGRRFRRAGAGLNAEVSR